MSEVLIRTDNLGKQYRLGGSQDAFKTLRDTLTDIFLAPIRRTKNLLRGQPYAATSMNEKIWALREVSLEIKSGEVWGIIGRNGAGKSTLLKILSRITEPTEGFAEIHGRVGSLLEVGTGFHPELTGRENIYLNGAIMGMKKAEIERKFEEIVAFAEIDKFIDTPVKRYSSGMYVRLAFAVAAHLEPEILLVDEVLAVGDALFQKKCLGKMGGVAKSGRTVLFVSHNMAAISKLCGRVIWLDEGQVRMIGAPDSVISAYLATDVEIAGERRWENLEQAPGNEKIRLRSVRILNSNGITISTVDVKHPFFVELQYDIMAPLTGVQVGFWVLTSDGTVVFVAGDKEDALWTNRERKAGKYKSACKIPARLLNSGHYTLTVASDLRNVELLFVEENAVSFQVEQTDIPAHSSTRPSGVICPFLDWQIHQLEGEE